MKYGNEWMTNQKTPYAIHEAALIFEANVNKRLDYVIGVSSPFKLRIRRAMERDKVTEEEILKRINRQMDEDKKMKLCDFIIQNDEKHFVIPQVLAIHKELLKK
jgi:dephospho-CoA kinase